MMAGQTEVETGQAGSLLLDNSVHLAPVAESDGQLVHQHPDEDEEQAPDKGEQSKGCLKSK